MVGIRNVPVWSNDRLDVAVGATRAGELVVWNRLNLLGQVIRMGEEVAEAAPFSLDWKWYNEL